MGIKAVKQESRGVCKSRGGGGGTQEGKRKRRKEKQERRITGIRGRAGEGYGGEN